MRSRLVAEITRSRTEYSFSPPTRRASRVFEEAQQLRLQRNIHLTDFVKEEGAAIGLFDETGTGLVGACESPLLGTEQFGFERDPGIAAQFNVTKGPPCPASCRAAETVPCPRRTLRARGP